MTLKNVSAISFLAVSILLLSLFLSGCSINIYTQPKSLAPMLKKASPTVVNIHSESLPLPCPAGEPYSYLKGTLDKSEDQLKPSSKESYCIADSIGSGVILNAENGYIVTSFHTIENANKIAVTLHDERVFSGKLIGKDLMTDLAIIQIKADKLTASSWANSDRLQVGDFVVAIGSPFGLEQTVTFGIISALHRSNIRLRAYENFIQTDAPINIGNSGGALLNMEGKLIGINTSIISRYGVSSGVGFAIPGNAVKKIAAQLIQYGDIQRGLLGVYIRTKNISDKKGAYISRIVNDSPAAKVGLKPGDRVVSLNGQPILNNHDLFNAIGLLRTNAEIDIVVLRQNKKIHFRLVLAQSI